MAGLQRGALRSRASDGTGVNPGPFRGVSSMTICQLKRRGPRFALVALALRAVTGSVRLHRRQAAEMKLFRMANVCLEKRAEGGRITGTSHGAPLPSWAAPGCARGRLLPRRRDGDPGPGAAEAGAGGHEERPRGPCAICHATLSRAQNPKPKAPGPKLKA